MNDTLHTHETSDAGRRTRLARALLFVERGLLAFGVVCLLVWGSACAQRSLYQATAHTRFDDSIRKLLAADGQHDQSEWSAARVAAYGDSRDLEVEPLARLVIPAAGVSVMVLDGTDETVLDRAVGRIEGTAEIGAAGNLGIAGHRDGFFRGLRHLVRGDELQVATLEGVTTYRVDELSIVEPEAVEVLDPTPDPSITLVTCYPFYFVGSAPQRYIVRGEWVGFDPWTDEVAAGYLHASNASP